MADKQSFDTLIVITPKDFTRLVRLYPRLISNIDYGRIFLISSKETESIISANPELAGEFTVVDENDLIRFDDVHECIRKKMENILAGRELPRGITGWYYQQFLKMQYAFVCRDEYYMVWDGDTIPCKKITMFQEESGKPYLDMKHEYHAEYFETMGTILPGFGKVTERSFISEHMLFRTDIMRELISDIESNESIPGTKFWEKIINAIPEEKIQNSAFSEFETYGTYVALKHIDAYKLREWHSFRQGGNFFKIDTISDRDFEWLSKDFEAISFEKGHEVREDNANLFDNPYYQEKLTPKQMLQAAQLEYKDGYKEVWADDMDAASANTTSGSFLSDEVVPESPLKYLEKDTYRIYEELGDKLVGKNMNQAWLCYENAEFLCEDEEIRKGIRKKKKDTEASGRVTVNKTAIIVLSYNNLYFTQRCIESIYTNCNPDSYFLVILDNASTDGSQEWLTTWGEAHDEALIILNDENLGFSAGNNAACQYVPEGHDIFYLNNDTRLPANALFFMRMALYSADDVGGVGGLQSYADADQLEDVKFDLPEQYVEFGASHNVPMENPLEEQSKLCGFAMLISWKAYLETGGFDEQFNPGFLEDDDMSLRIRNLGYKLIVCHNSYIYHAGSQSFIKRNDTNELFRKHRELLIQKWGFDSSKYAVMSVNELEFIKTIEAKGFDRDSSFNLLHIGCGCGNMLGRVHFMYPNAHLYGIEPNDDVRRFTISCVNVYKDISELPIDISEFDFVAKELG